jgi:hypothetical protein
LVRTAFEGAHHVHWDQRGLLDADVVELMAKLLAPARNGRHRVFF